jgi:DNA (cytosine-5)-methyltransferase 1
MGYYRAGFDVVGVDKERQKNYPFGFIKADVMTWLPEMIDSGRIERFDVIAASPPCQKYSRLNQIHKGDHPDLVGPIRELLIKTGKPYVIENVEGSPLGNPLKLCGSMFGLRVYRHRLFECNPTIWFPPFACHHWGKTAKKGQPKHAAQIMTVTGAFRVQPARDAMGINWMNQAELSQAIPPAYCEYIGKQMIDTLGLAS